MSALVVDPAEVEVVARALAAAPLVAFDVEFLSADRLVPVLCLVQVAWVSPTMTLDAPAAEIVAAPLEIRILDPLAVDLGPVVRALAAHPAAVAHAPRQDLAILAARFDVEMPAVIDTQLMAAFAGLGDQIGFATLANELLGLALGKEQQWTDWSRRPLSPAQLAYAEADVRHLPALYALLSSRLGDRLAWARAESAQIAADAVAAARVTPTTAWRQLGGLRGLDAGGLAAAIALAAWRYRVAIELDRPLGQVLPEKVLLELARHRPATASAVRASKGLSPVSRQRAEEITEALVAARPTEVPELGAPRAPSARALRWAELLLSIVQLVAEHTGVAPRLLATRADAEEFARTVDERGLAAAEPLPALATWRRAVIGQPWIDWLTGRLALVGDLGSPQGLATVAT